MLTTVFYFLSRLFVWLAPAPPTLLALGILLLSQPLACLLRLVWAAAAALMLKDCDFATKILPEKLDYWSGRVAWVTGASSGIGLSLVRQLAARGCYIMMSSRKEEDLRAARDDAIAFARKLGVNRTEKDFFLLAFDMKDRQNLASVVETARKWKRKVDFFFSNAGVACRGVMLPAAIDQEILDVNLCSQMHLVKLVVALMIQQRSGHVIMTNSMSARITLGGRTAYSAAKAGLLNFAYGLSRELQGMHCPVKITSVLPGYIKTNLCDRELYADQLSLSKGAHIAVDIQTGLSADRSAELMLRGSSRGLREIWVGKNPDLFYMYCMYYVPNIANRLVDQGAAAYLRSIEHEIRERHYAERRAAGLAVKEKDEDAQLIPPSAVLSKDVLKAAVSQRDPTVSQQEEKRKEGASEESLHNDKEAGRAERQIPSVFPPRAKDMAKVAAVAVADAAAQLQGAATIKTKNATGTHHNQKPEPSFSKQDSKQQHRSHHTTDAAERKREGEPVDADEKREEAKEANSHTGGAGKQRSSASHTTTPDQHRDSKNTQTSDRGAVEKMHH